MVPRLYLCQCPAGILAAFDDLHNQTKPAGIGQAVFVDYSKEACRTIEENLETCDFEGRSLVVCKALALAASVRV